MALAERDLSSGFGEAFCRIKCLKNLVWMLLVLAILCQAAAFAAVEFAGVLNERYAGNAAITVTTAPTDTEKPALVLPNQVWYYVISWTMVVSKFASWGLCVILALMLLLSVQLALLGRLDGVGAFISAFFWSLVLLAILTPWQQMLHSSFARGAMSNFSDLVIFAKRAKPSWGASTPVASMDIVSYYAFFFAFPLVALAVALLVQMKFAAGFKRNRTEQAKPPGTV